MWSALKNLFASKTTWWAVVGSAVMMLAAKLVVVIGIPFELQSTILTAIASLFGLKALQQGFADFGKNQPK